MKKIIDKVFEILADQISPRWNNSNVKKSLLAVQKVTGEKDLFQVAMKTIHSDVAIAAVNRITDASLLHDLMLQGERGDIYRAVAARITD